MPDLLPLTGLYGKIPAHGDFVRRGLPSSFVTPWDDWLAAGIERAREGLGTRWTEAWDAAPAWRFLLPAGACGPDMAAGVMLPSMDTVGRRFPITLVALLPAGAPPPDATWFDALEGAALAGRSGAADADALAAAIPDPAQPVPAVAAFPLPATMPAPLASPDAQPGGDGLSVPHEATVPQVPVEIFAEEAEQRSSADLGGTLAQLIGAEPTPSPSGDPLLSLFSDDKGGGSEAVSPAPAQLGEDPVLAIFGQAGGATDPASGSDADGADLLATFAAALPGIAQDGPAPATLPPMPEGEVAAPCFIPDGDDFLAGLTGAEAALPPVIDQAAPLPAIPDATDVLAGFAAALPPGREAETLDPVDADDLLAGFAAAGLMQDGAAPKAASDGQPPGGTEQGLPGLSAAMDDVPPAAAAEGGDALWADAAFAPAAPPAPEGGGWWTRGAAHVPPMVWAFASLPSSDHFAYLLEAEA